jgi:hypothetical protein
MQHDNLCLTPEPFGPICLSCANIENVREDEHYRIIEKLETLPHNSSLVEIIEIIRP